MSEASLAT